MMPEGAKVGDVLKADLEVSLDGVEITNVFAPRPERPGPELLEIIGSGDDGPLVTSQLVPGRSGRDRRGRDSRDRRDRRDRPRRDRDRNRDRDRKGRGGRSRDGERGRDRSKRRDQAPRRPRAKRLKAGRAHRKAALQALPDEQRPLADEVLRGGVPGLRQAIDRMNEKASAEGMPKINGDPLIALAERLAPELKAAEWRDRADAALAGMAEIDLRDIRSVVVAADSGARDEEGREIAERLRVGLAERVETEHRKWLAELAQTIAEGRTVRALRLSSRPPKAGTPLPPDMAERLAASASAGLDSETGQDRWETVLDAVAFSPVRTQVTPQGLPANPGDSLMATVKKLASRVPQIAAAFGVEAPAPRGPKGRRPKRPPPPPPPPAAEPAASEPPTAGDSVAQVAPEDPTT